MDTPAKLQANMAAEPAEVRIRNQRYRPWVEIAGVMLIAFFLFTAALPLVDGRFDRLAKYSLLGALVLMAGYCLRTWLLVVDLKRGPWPRRRAIGRAVFRRVFLGLRSNHLGPVPAETIALAALGWLLPRRLSVPFVSLGGSVNFDSRVPIPLRAVCGVRFAPDPAEDYAEWDRPAQYSAAAIELVMGREFRLILSQDDAQRLRQWAAAKGIPVRDGDGYAPRSAQTADEVLRP